MTYHVGFTGSRNGMSLEQKATFKIALADILQDPEIAAAHSDFCFHHGDCMGADAEAHDFWLEAFTENDHIEVHPPTIDTFRAFKEGNVSHEAKHYLERDDDIVLAANYLIATPGSMRPKVRSGTWYTIRKAAATHVPGSVILPDGMVYPVSDYEVKR